MNTDIWVILPSANPKQAAITLPKWRDKGYEIAVLLDGPPIPHGAMCTPINPYRDHCDVRIYVESSAYAGYPWAITTIVQQLPDVDLFWAIGDDMHPPANYSPAEMAAMFLKRFPDGDGVLQGTGDPWGHGAASRICGSPIFGRKLAERMYGGRGPFCQEYYHFFADEELKCVAERDGFLLQVPTVNIHHDHWHRNKQPRPEHMHAANENWAKDKATFERRKAAGFPGAV